VHKTLPYVRLGQCAQKVDDRSAGKINIYEIEALQVLKSHSSTQFWPRPLPTPPSSSRFPPGNTTIRGPVVFQRSPLKE